MNKVLEKLQNTPVFFRDNIIRALQDKKALNIVELNLSKLKLTLFDRFIICTATSNTHAEALCDSVLETIKEDMHVFPKHVEGMHNSQWILIDYFDVLVHIFLKESREFYDIESLWIDAERIEYNFTKA
ncbi:MAG: ribosome silencing factor [Bacteroidales bacterium]|nr:ribosome silencing factor [Bacteroidales bacterium]